MCEAKASWQQRGATMTEEQKRKVQKQIDKAKNMIIKANNEIDTISKILQEMGYMYDAVEANDEIIFIPIDKNKDIENAFDEHYILEDLRKTY